ncbi:MAG: succinate dehydrogenase assembly factor 2 [Paracoccaceae bacterium]
MAEESPEARLRRMTMRSWRRGMKEMDLVLGPYADAHLAAMSAADRDLFEALLAENDQDIFPWITGAATPPARFAPLIARITAFAVSRHHG